jgi:prolyl oligopeptidase
VRCLVQLSPGGSDADVVREFDLSTLKFVDGGFTLPLAKSDVDWLDINTVLVGTDLGEGSLTDSGYPRVTRRWSRGTPISAATPLFEGQKTDVAVSASHDEADSRPRTMVNRAVTFYTNEVYEVTKKGLAKIDKPDDCDATVDGDFIYFQPRSDWTVGGTVYRGGSLLRAPYKAWKKGKRAVEPLFTPTDTTSLSGWSLTPNTIVLEILDNVRTRVELLREGEGGLVRAPLAGLPALGDIGVWPVNGDERDTLFVTTTDYLTPSTLSLTEPDGSPAVLKRSPSFFSAEGLAVSQHFATSKDGTRVPYFEVAPKQIPAGGLPTLLYGYGGFEVSLTPGYSAAAGIAWMERGGVYVVANIRGGGEFGTRWHEAGRREGKFLAHEDFAAVAADLVRRGVSLPQRIAAEGGSNGGLLIANMLVRHPTKFGALFCTIPLIDMRRYSRLLAGASWVAEYGDPDKPEDWAFLRRISAYHTAEPGKAYPPILIATTRRDDRVHPGHARKMAARLEALGHRVAFHEPAAGGHGYGKDNKERAMFTALGLAFLRESIGWRP